MREMLVWVQMHKSIYVNDNDDKKNKNPHSGSKYVGGRRSDAEHFFFFLAETSGPISTCGVAAREHRGAIDGEKLEEALALLMSAGICSASRREGKNNWSHLGDGADFTIAN